MGITLSAKKGLIKQSEIRNMTRECLKAEGINLAQGICDLEIPASVMQAAKDAIDSGYNIYTASEGLSRLRRAIAEKHKRFYGQEFDHKSEIMVSMGATGAFYTTALSTLNPGDEVIVFEPYYSYHAATLESIGCVPRFVRLKEPEWTFDKRDLESVLTKNTRGIIINTPANPCGKVFSQTELELIGDFAQSNGLLVFSDEIYEHFVYDGLTHIPPATIPTLKDRTITISGFSKIFSITGWRLGYAIAPAHVIETATHFNDLIYVCPPTPLQFGAAKGLIELPDSYYENVASEHQAKRDRFCAELAKAGLTPHIPHGAYYVLADVSMTEGNTVKEKVMALLHETGIASVPGNAFYHEESDTFLARFCFAKKEEILEKVYQRLVSKHS